MRAAHLTHQNITAGVTAIRALLPASAPFSALDTVISAHSLSTAFGRTVAYTALYEGTSFTTLDSSKVFQLDNGMTHDPDHFSVLVLTSIFTVDSPSPLHDVMSTQQVGLPPATVFFLKPTQLDAVVNTIISNAKKSFIFPLAWRHKLAGLSEGYFTKESLWDRLVFDNARSTVFGERAASLRAVVVSEGTVPASLLTPARIALSVPLVVAHTHPLVSAPILASHPHDVQTFIVTSDQDPAHVGPPTVNIEVKLVGVDDKAVERGDDPEGVLHVRGPIVGRVLPLAESTVGDEEPKIDEPWVSTGNRARVQTNGAFKAWSPAKV